MFVISKANLWLKPAATALIPAAESSLAVRDSL